MYYDTAYNMYGIIQNWTHYIVEFFDEHGFSVCFYDSFLNQYSDDEYDELYGFSHKENNYLLAKSNIKVMIWQD